MNEYGKKMILAHADDTNNETCNFPNGQNVLAIK